MAKCLFIGDQSDFNHLKQTRSCGPYDVIIDDGGHSWKQQIHSLIGLWPYLKRNVGIYVIEDLHTSFHSDFKDFNITTIDFISRIVKAFSIYEETKSGLNKNRIQMTDNFMQQEIEMIIGDLISIDCFRFACVLRKWDYLQNLDWP